MMNQPKAKTPTPRSAPKAGAGPAAASPDDILFGDAVATLPKGRAIGTSSVDDGWAAMEKQPMPGFADVGGGDQDLAAMLTPSGAEPAPAVSRGMNELFGQGSASAMPARPPVQPTAAPQPVRTPSGVHRGDGRNLTAPAALPEQFTQRRRNPLLALASLAFLAGGAGAGGWLHYVQHNPVLAGIVASFGAVSSLMAWLASR